MSEIARVSLISPLGTAVQLVLGTASRRSGLLGSLSLSSLSPLVAAVVAVAVAALRQQLHQASNNFGYVLSER